MSVRDDAAMSVYIAIRTSPRFRRRALSSKFPTEGDAAAKAFTDIIMAALQGYEITRKPGYGAEAPST